MMFHKSAQYYDDFYNAKYDGRSDKEVKYLESIIKKYKAKKILDLGCGTGRHTLALAKKGYDIIGVDISEDMIDIALLKKNNADINTWLNTTFVVGDMRNTYCGSNFDLIYSMFQSMNYLLTDSNLRDTLYNVNTQLKKGGIFVFDCWYGPSIEKYGCPKKSFSINKGDYKIFRDSISTIHYGTRTVDVEQYFTLLNTKSLLHRLFLSYHFKEKHTMKFHYLTDINPLIIDAGFEIIKIEEWITKKKPSPDTWAITFICKKVR